MPLYPERGVWFERGEAYDLSSEHCEECGGIPYKTSRLQAGRLPVHFMTEEQVGVGIRLPQQEVLIRGEAKLPRHLIWDRVGIQIASLISYTVTTIQCRNGYTM